MLRGALIAGLLALSAPTAAQESTASTSPPPATGKRKMGTDFLGAPASVTRHPQRARPKAVKPIDIPQAAKDEGHNGRATYTITVGPDGTLISLILKESSMSPAIDEAVKARLETARYIPATDKDGNKVQGTADAWMTYARHDADSPGGGIETYTCGDLVREWDWFTAANAARRKLFWPHNAYTSLTSVEAMRQGVTPSRTERLSARAKREAMWAKLIKRCRKTPARLMLEEVDQPQAYANLVNSF